MILKQGHDDGSQQGGKSGVCENGRSYAKLGMLWIELIPKYTRRPLEKRGNGLILNGCIGKH